MGTGGDALLNIENPIMGTNSKRKKGLEERKIRPVTKLPY